MKPDYIVISSDSDSEPDEPPNDSSKEVIDLTCESDSETPIFRFSLPIKVEANSGRAYTSGDASARYARQATENPHTSRSDRPGRKGSKEAFHGIITDTEKFVDPTVARGAVVTQTGPPTPPAVIPSSEPSSSPPSTHVESPIESPQTVKQCSHHDPTCEPQVDETSRPESVDETAQRRGQPSRKVNI